jgi:Uncharacterized conserved protein
MKNLKPVIDKIFKGSVSVLVSSFLSAWALYGFINPNGFVGGGFSGVATILENAGIVKAYVSWFVMNIPLLVLAVIFLKKDFAVKTVATAGMVSVLMALMDKFHFFKFTDDRLLASIYSGIIYGIGTGVIFEGGGSGGGTDIIAKLISAKRPTVRPSIIIFILDVVVIIAGLAIFDVWSVVYAVICAFFFERAMYFYLGKGRFASLFYVVTDKPDDLIAEINESFKSDGYGIEARGAYTGTKKTLVKFLLPTGNVKKVENFLKEKDENSFAFVASARRVTDFGERKKYEK